MGSMNSFHDKHDDKLIKNELNCSSCHEPISRNTLTCYKGHWYGEKCKTKKEGKCYKLFVTQQIQ